MATRMSLFRSVCRLRQQGTGLVLALGLLLAGCAGQPKPETGQNAAAMAAQAQAEAQTQAAEYQRIIAELRRASECVTSIEGQPEYAPLRAKAPGGRDDPNPTYLLDKSKATAAQGRLIESFLGAMGPCQPNFGALSIRAHQNITRMISDTWMQQQDLYRHLKEGRITWGVFNQGSKSNADKLSGGLQALRLTNEG